MSYWNCNPELYDEIIFKALIKHGLAIEEDWENDKICELILNAPLSIVLEAEKEYWADRIEQVSMDEEF